MAGLHSENGFTLAELLLALVILAVGLLGTMKMQMSSIHGNAFGGRMTTAIALAQNQMETLLDQDLEATGGPSDPATNAWPDSGSQKTYSPSPVSDPVVLGVAYTGYTVAWTITANAPFDNAATYNVRVTWPGSLHPIDIVSTRRR